MDIKQAFQIWEQDIKPAIIEQYGADDGPALAESWNNYTDSLCKDGELTGLQYNYCPAYDDDMPDDDREYILDQLGLTLDCEFVPFSNSRNAKEIKSVSDFSINWKCTVKKGSQSLTVDYSQGIGHLPKSIQPGLMGRVSVDQFNTVKAACETGQAKGRKVVEPDLEDVVYSLLMDSEVIDYSDFEDWAESLGFDTDSRAAKKAYKACLGIALKLRAMLGDSVLSDLRELFSDY